MSVDDGKPAAPEPAAPEPATPQAMPPQQPRWADPIFRMGLAVGGILLALGLVCQGFTIISATISSLIICSGLGIIFGAFGSTAVINYKGFVVAGVAAISIALLLLVDYMVRDDLVRLRIDGDVRGARLDLVGDETYPGADHERYFEFVIIGREVKSERLTLIVTMPGENPTDHREVLFECVPGRAVGAFLGSGRPLQWRFDASREQLVGPQGGPVVSGPCPDGTTTTAEADKKAFSLIGKAFAKDQPSVGSLIKDLELESAIVRRNARKALTAMGVAAVAPMMAAWTANPDNYQVRLGISVALAEFLRDNKKLRQAVSGLLTVDHLRLLTVASGDPDRTIRIYASEFLFDLGDKRVLPLVRAAFPSATDDGKFNLIVVLEGTVPALSKTEKNELASMLRQWAPTVGAKTQARIDQLFKKIDAS